MPLTKIQPDVLRMLASHRDPERDVGGSTPLNREAQRYSGDIDVFHDREDRLAAAAMTDAKTLEKRQAIGFSGLDNYLSFTSLRRN